MIKSQEEALTNTEIIFTFLIYGHESFRNNDMAGGILFAIIALEDIFQFPFGKEILPIFTALWRSIKNLGFLRLLEMIERI